MRNLPSLFDVTARADFNMALPIVVSAVRWIFAICFAGLVMGFILVVLGATGEAKVTFFGVEISSSNVGVVVMVISLAAFVYMVRAIWTNLLEILKYDPGA